MYASIAQLAERDAVNVDVLGSSPSGGAIGKVGRVWVIAAVLKTVGDV